MSIDSNDQQDRHFHGLHVVVHRDNDADTYGEVRLQDATIPSYATIYEGPVRECEALANMIENVGESVRFAIRNNMNLTDIEQTFRRSNRISR